MLGFVLSKMQMLLFATGIFIVALLFFNFVSQIELSTSSTNIILASSNIVREQVSSDAKCMNQTDSIPERIIYGLGTNQLFYDLRISKKSLGESNVMIFSINEHKKTNIISSKSLPMKANIVLVSSDFIPTDEPITDPMYDKEEIVLYPRAALKTGQSSSINSFVSLRESVGGITTIYIIPCAVTNSQGALDNCLLNIIKVGCYKLSKSNPSPTDKVPICFDVSSKFAGQDCDSIVDAEARSRCKQQAGALNKEITWAECKAQGYAS